MSKTRSKKRKKRKRPVARTPAGVAHFKEQFLKQVSFGRSVGVAARAAGIDRTTVYGWRNDDPEFAAKWKDAEQLGLDRLETSIYDEGMRGTWQASARYLKAKGRTEWADHVPEDKEQRTAKVINYFANITLSQQLERLQRLGLPAPVIESDREEDYAPDGDEANNP